MFPDRFMLATRTFKVGAQKGNEKEGRYHGQATPANIMGEFAIAGSYCHANLMGGNSLRHDITMLLCLRCYGYGAVPVVCLRNLPFTIDNRAMCNQPYRKGFAHFNRAKLYQTPHSLTPLITNSFWRSWMCFLE